MWISCSSYSSWLVLGFVGRRRSPRLLPLFFFTKLFSPWISGADRSRDQALVPAAFTLLPGHVCGRAHGGQQSSPWAASTPHRGSPHGLWGLMHDPLGLPGHCLGSLQGRGHNLCQASWCRTHEGSVGGLRVGNGAFSWDPGILLSPQTFPDTGTPVSPSQGSAASAHHLLVISAHAPELRTSEKFSFFPGSPSQRRLEGLGRSSSKRGSFLAQVCSSRLPPGEGGKLLSQEHQGLAKTTV